MAALGRVIADPSRLVTHRYRLLHQDGHFVPIEGRASNLLADPFVRGNLDQLRTSPTVWKRRRSFAAPRRSWNRRSRAGGRVRAANLMLQREIEERRQAEGHLRHGWPRPWPSSRSPRFRRRRSPDSRPCSSRWGRAMQVSQVFLRLLREGSTIESAYEWRRRPEDAHGLFAGETGSPSSGGRSKGCPETSWSQSRIPTCCLRDGGAAGSCAGHSRRESVLLMPILARAACSGGDRPRTGRPPRTSGLR